MLLFNLHFFLLWIVVTTASKISIIPYTNNTISSYDRSQNLIHFSDSYNSAKSNNCSECKAIDENEKNGEGVYFISYSNDNSTLKKYYDEAVKSAKRIKFLDPTINIAIGTNMIIPEDEKQLWSHIINIPHHHIFKGVPIYKGSPIEKEFFTRVMYLGATPFKTTFHSDTTVYFCDSEAPREILNLMKQSDVDFAISSRLAGNFRSSTWALLYNWNSRTKLFFHDFLSQMLRDGIHPNEEQSPSGINIVNVLSTNRVKISRLSSNWAFTPSCKTGDGTLRYFPCNLLISIPINGRVRLTHAQNDNICKTINNGPNRDLSTKRALIKLYNTNGKNNMIVVTSQKEIDSTISPYKVPPVDWNMTNKSSTSIFWETCDYNNKQICGFS